MTIAENVKETIEKFSFRDEAIIYCSTMKELLYFDITEGVDSYTSIFVFDDDSSLSIDTQNFVYTNSETELDTVKNWGN
jgi:hypothetical protein